jgi:hypothetical protein
MSEAKNSQEDHPEPLSDGQKNGDIWLFAAVILTAVSFLVLTWLISQTLSPQTREAPELAEPASLEPIILKPSTLSDFPSERSSN